MSMDYSKFKSGSDIRGYALGDEANPLYMSDEMVMRCAYAFAMWLKNKTGKDGLYVSVGHDSRLSAERIKNAVIKALTSNGVRVADCGLSSTPAMFMTTVDIGCDGAVQITASHHPKDRNGLKFFTRDGGLDGSDIADILRIAGEAEEFIGNENEECAKCDFMSRYAEILRNMIIEGVDDKADREHPLKGMKIVVDAGNGVGGFYAKDVLEVLGADTSGSIYLEPDGNFPNHAPNPENAQAMECVSRATADANADFGVIFDTDVDRAACVGKGGFEINRNRLVALASKIALTGCNGGTIVTDSVTSDGLAEFIAANGGRHLRFKRGYRNVINKQIELCKSGIPCPLAMETSGHAAFSENYFLDDGAYLITKLIIEAAALAKKGQTLEGLIENLREAKEEKELRFKILCDDFRPEGEKIIELFENEAKNHEGWTACNDNYEGIRINSADGKGWFLLRLSVHDPIIVLNTESDEIGGTLKMCKAVHDVISTAANIDLLDILALTDYIKEEQK
ncbi:MAG: phosphomannomutase/phosphoglucomutase [Clostridia bacterium]|nr:phosphomannomutase/phosphoglucomutase [Clostridia bacterium]